MQLEFFLRDESDLQRDLIEAADLPIEITITDNSRTIMSVSRDRQFGGVRLRLHHMFLDADMNVVRAVAAWVKRPKSRIPELDAFIRENRHRMRRKKPRATTLRTDGGIVNLARLFDEVNKTHFGGAISTAITWGRNGNGARRHQRSIRFGSFTAEDNLIRIHPALDQPFVPEYFVRFIVFHEMLHAHLGIEECESGRRRIHTREFRQMERAYPDFAKATAWERSPSNMKKLLKKH